MSEITTEHVREQFARQENYDEFYEGDLFNTPDGQVSAAEFDAWLAAHDALVRAEAWDEGFMDRGKYNPLAGPIYRANPHRALPTSPPPNESNDPEPWVCGHGSRYATKGDPCVAGDWKFAPRPQFAVSPEPDNEEQK